MRDKGGMSRRLFLKTLGIAGVGVMSLGTIGKTLSVGFKNDPHGHKAGENRLPVSNAPTWPKLAREIRAKKLKIVQMRPELFDRIEASVKQTHRYKNKKLADAGMHNVLIQGVPVVRGIV